MTASKGPKELRRRRQANVLGGRKRRHEVLVTEREAEELRRLADEQRVSVPRLLIESALSATGETSTRRRAAMSELFAIRRVLAGVANNINQIARVANTEERVSGELRATLAELDARMQMLDETIDELAFS